MIIEPLLQVTYRSDVGLPKVSDEAAPPRAAAHRPRVVIVGSGFGGLSAARALGNRDRRELSRLLMVELDAQLGDDIAGWKTVRDIWRKDCDITYPD